MNVLGRFAPPAIAGLYVTGSYALGFGAALLAVAAAVGLVAVLG